MRFWSHLLWISFAGLVGLSAAFVLVSGGRAAGAYFFHSGQALAYRAPPLAALAAAGEERPRDITAVPHLSYDRLSPASGQPLSVSARSYLVADLDTGEVILEKGPARLWPVASLTKLVTALVSLETVNQSQLATVSTQAIQTVGDRAALSAGERLPVGELVYPLLLKSSNAVAEVLAEHTGRARFVERMNGEARAIGLTATYFADPSGVSPANVSSAEDLFKLDQYLDRSQRQVLEITREAEHTAASHVWENNNALAKRADWLGGKTGLTAAAGETLIGNFSVTPANSVTRRVAVILLQSADRERDAEVILNYLTNRVTYQPENN